MALLKYDPEVYTPQGAKRALTEREARAEYARLRSIAIKRLKRFEGTEFTDTQVFLKYKDIFIPTRKIKNERDVRYLLSEVASFLRLPYSTISGQRALRKRTVETLQRRGYIGITERNFIDFGRYMQRARALSIAKFFDSVRAAELYSEYSGEESMDEIIERFRGFEKEQLKERARRRRDRKKTR